MRAALPHMLHRVVFAGLALEEALLSVEEARLAHRLGLGDLRLDVLDVRLAGSVGRTVKLVSKAADNTGKRLDRACRRGGVSAEVVDAELRQRGVGRLLTEQVRVLLEDRCSALDHPLGVGVVHGEVHDGAADAADGDAERDHQGRPWAAHEVHQAGSDRLQAVEADTQRVGRDRRSHDRALQEAELDTGQTRGRGHGVQHRVRHQATRVQGA
jgi:hypothetical protein